MNGPCGVDLLIKYYNPSSKFHISYCLPLYNNVNKLLCKKLKIEKYFPFLFMELGNDLKSKFLAEYKNLADSVYSIEVIACSGRFEMKLT